MLMPECIDSRLLAPCGVNCFACYKHLAPKKPCAGCLAGNQGKPEHCCTCAIKECCERRGILRCSQCPDFPCKENKRMERNYKKYGVSLIGNLEQDSAIGTDAFMESERIRWQCPDCEGVMSQHRPTCSECGRAQD